MTNRCLMERLRSEHKTQKHWRYKCGSGLARECAVSVTRCTDCSTAFASKPAPTFLTVFHGKKKRQPEGWRFFVLHLHHCGFLRPKPGRWPEPAGAPRRLPDGSSATSFGPGRLFAAGLAGRLVLALSAGRSDAGEPRPSPRLPRPPLGASPPRAGRGVRGPRSPSWRDGAVGRRSPSMCGSREMRPPVAGAFSAGRRVRATRSVRATGLDDLRCIRSSLSLLLAFICGMATGVRPTSALRISTSYWLISRQRPIGRSEFKNT